MYGQGSRVKGQGTLLIHLPAEVVKVTDEISVEHDEIELMLESDDFILPNGQAFYSGDYAQAAFDGELYGYLTWSTGGTYWDIDPLFITGNNIDSRPVNFLMQAIATDMFEKIATQVVDFDEDGFATDVNGFHGGLIGDINDIDLLFQEFGETDELSRYDLDVDGDVDAFDLFRIVILIYYTRLGDANLDGFVDAMDLNKLGQNWLRTDATSWLQGDFNGDGKVDHFDLNALGLNWQKGQA